MKVFEKNNFSLLAVFVGLIMVYPLIYAATYPNIQGAPWVGTVSGVDANCMPPSLNGPFTDNITIVFSNQVNGSFDVSITGNDSTGQSFSETGSGSFSSPTIINFTTIDAIGADIDTTSITGTISGNTMALTFSGFNTGGDLCTYTGSGSLTQTTANIIVNPATTPGSTVTEAILFTTQITGAILDISSHITSALAGRSFFSGPRFSDDQFKIEGGLNAGDASIPFGVWGNYSYTDFENKLSSLAFDGGTHSVLGGVDFALWENTVLGIAFGYSNSDIDTTFNLGHQDTDSYTIAPYFGALLTDNLSIDINFGYSTSEYDQFRTLVGTTTRVTSSPDSDSLFTAFNINGVTYRDNWIFGTRVGLLWAENIIDSYTESNGVVVAESRSHVSSGSIAGDVAYSMQDFEPFLNLSYQYDFSLTEIAVTTGPQPSNDNDDVLLTTGVRYFNKYGVSGNLKYSKRFDRDDFSEDRIGLTVRADY